MSLTIAALQANVGAPFALLIPSGSNPAPTQLFECQDVSVDFAVTQELLHGPNQIAIESMDSQQGISGKIKHARILSSAVAIALAGSTSAPGRRKFVPEEAGTVTTLLVTVSGSATWYSDGGVKDVLTGKYYKRVASGPAAGEYSVAAGVYTFNSGDNGRAVKISYVTTDASNGSTITLGNPASGISPKYRLEIYNNHGANGALVLGAVFWSVVVGKLGLGFKNSGFTVPDLDWKALADPTNGTATIYTE